jgi:hypothetical protein
MRVFLCSKNENSEGGRPRNVGDSETNSCMAPCGPGVGLSPNKPTTRQLNWLREQYFLLCAVCMLPENWACKYTLVWRMNNASGKAEKHCQKVLRTGYFVSACRKLNARPLVKASIPRSNKPTVRAVAEHKPRGQNYLCVNRIRGPTLQPKINGTSPSQREAENVKPYAVRVFDG